MAITEITGKITHDDGETSEFRIAADASYVPGWHQWGNNTSVHGRNVDVLDLLVEAVREERRDTQGHEPGTLGEFLHNRRIPGVPCGCSDG